MSDLISKQEVTEILRTEWVKLFPIELDPYLSLAIEKIENIPPAQQWVPVSEDLPKDEEIKLVTCKSKKGILNVNRAYYMDGHWHGSGSMSNVIAWMDPPEPYKEVAE